MPVLGNGGRLRLKREAPAPTVLRPGNVHVASKSIYMRNPAFWSGDEVTLTCEQGLPIDTGSDGPDVPDGYGMYAGGDWYIGSNRDHVTTNADPYYSGTNSDPFYMRAAECGQTTSYSCFIYRDQLDRLSLYTTRAAALNGSTADRLTLYKTDFHALIVSPVGSVEYENAIAECAGDVGDYQFSDTQDEVTLESICDFAPDYTEPAAWITEYDNADITPRYFINAGTDGSIWTIQCMLSDWNLNLSAPEVDTTALGDKFGESVKSIVTGGGQLDFLIERQATEGEADSTQLMQLLMLTEKGSKADAEFWMIENRASAADCSDLLPGSLYYETQLLVTSVAINTRAGELIAGSLNFVTVGEIALRMGTN